MLFVGVDIGLKGAIVALDGSGQIVEQITTPVVGSISKPMRHDRAGVKRFCEGLLSRGPVHVCIEAPQSRRIYCVRCGMRQGFDLTSIKMQSYAEIWRMGFAGISTTFEEVHANSWRVVLKGAVELKEHAPKRAQLKKAAIVHARRLYPALNLRPGKMRTDHDGIAEAALIATYCRSKIMCRGPYA